MRLFRRMLSVTLAVLMAAVITVMPAAQITAKAEADSGSVSGGDAPGKYISEVRIGLGKSKDAAAKSLEGYTILKDDDGEYADLNKDAGSNSIIGSKGAKVVLLGYKTTDDPKEAITDLAVMNMDGGYSVKDYEALMDRYLETQIKPFISSFLVAIQEYRANYNSSNPDNKKRAQYVHDALNKLYDDDTQSYLGDLLLSETKWEMDQADPEAYGKLSDAEKKKHADIVTILCQANGQATLTLQNLLTRATDTSDDTWIDRFVKADAEATMGELFPNMTKTDAEAMMANIFGGDAAQILTLWDSLLSDLKHYDDAVEYAENFDSESIDEDIKTVKENAGEDKTAKEAVIAAVAEFDIAAKQTEFCDSMNTVAIHDFLESVEYFDEFTLLDYFMQSKDDAASDMMTLYALIMSLSPGQRAGLVNISLQDLIAMAMTESAEYDSANLAEIKPASIYEGVDRQIYEKGGVALTSEALRKQAVVNDTAYDPLSTLSKVMIGVSAAAAIATIGTWIRFGSFSSTASSAMKAATDFTKANHFGLSQSALASDLSVKLGDFTQDQLKSIYNLTDQELNQVSEARTLFVTADKAAQKSASARNLATGMTIVTVALTALTVYLTYRELCDYYDTDFSPIPAYMVDEADITTKNAKGETVVIKNQTAYYKAALCNRTEKDEKFGEIGNKADLNGDVGRKWVALYSVKNEAQMPILADSFKVVYGTSNVPLDYDRGIHKFGSGAAFDMNNTYYAWNHGKGGIYVYFKLDDAVNTRANAVGTVQTAGTIAAVGVGGILVGMLAGLLLTAKRNKKNDGKEAA